MLKILRRYNKLILVFGGCLLMVLFLIPSVGKRGMGAGMSATVARYEGGKITQSDLMHAQRELEVLDIVRSDSTGVSIGALLGRLLDPAAVNGRGIEGLEHWLLLTAQARRAGLIGGPEDGAALLERVANDLSTQFNVKPEEIPAVRDRMVSEFNATRDAAIRTRGQLDTDAALAHAHGVMRLLTAYRGFFPLSRPEALSVARDVFDKVTVDFIEIPGSAFIEQTPEATADRINEFFNAHKNKKPADDEFRIGYIRPAAARFEWLAVDHQKIAESLTIDPVEVNKFWRQNKDQFGENFSDARLTVEREYRSREADKLLQRARESVEGRIRLATSSVAKQNGQPPLTLKDVEQLLLKALPPAPEGQSFTTFNEAMEGWSTATQLASAPGIGQSMWRVNERQGVPFNTLVMSMKEAGGTLDPILENIAGSLKPTVPFGPLVDSVNSLYYFRVLEARPEGPPASVAEIQAQVTEDLRTLDGYAIAVKRAEEFRAQLAEKGAGEMLNQTKLSPRMTPSVEITRTSVRQKSGTQAFPDFDVPEFRDVIMNHVAAWDPMKDITTLPAIDRTLAIPVKARRAVVLVDIKSRFPLTQEAFKTGEMTVINYFRQGLYKQYTDKPFSMERLTEIMKVKDASGKPAKTKKSEAPAEDAAASKAPAESKPAG